MRLGLNIGYLTGRDNPHDQLRLVHHAEALGFDVVWAAEAYGSDSPTMLAWLAGQTTRIGLGSAVMQIPGRTPAMTAMTAATLNLLSAGRFRLGLGVSGPQVSEGWHGVGFDRPLGRSREYLQVVQQALAGKTVTNDGAFYPLPLPGGVGKPLKLTLAAPSPPVPIYLAAVGPKNLQLAGELADGWLAVFFTAGFAAEQLAQVAAGRATSGHSLAGFDVVATMPLVFGDDVVAGADQLRNYAALYLGGMGSAQQNFYNQLAVRMGFADAAAQVQRLYLDRQHRAASAAVPHEFIEQTSLLGNQARLQDRLAELADSGVTTCTVSPFGVDLEHKLAALSVVAAAHASL